MIRTVKRKKRKTITSTVKALISDYGGKKWSQRELVVYENGSEYRFFSIQYFYIRQKISQRGNEKWFVHEPQTVARSVPGLLR